MRSLAIFLACILAAAFAEKVFDSLDSAELGDVSEEDFELLRSIEAKHTVSEVFGAVEGFCIAILENNFFLLKFENSFRRSLFI